jgi:septum formation protein
MKRICLASTSETRKALLSQTSIPFRCVSPDVDEDMTKARLNQVGANAAEIASALAMEKALSVAHHTSDVVLAADQMLDFKGRVFSKTKSERDVVSRLSILQDQSHFLHSAFCFAKKGRIVHRGLMTVSIHIKAMTTGEIERHLAGCTCQLPGTLGGYRVECPCFGRIGILRGDFNAALGLPLKSVISFLNEISLRKNPRHA